MSGKMEIQTLSRIQATKICVKFILIGFRNVYIVSNQYVRIDYMIYHGYHGFRNGY